MQPYQSRTLAALRIPHGFTRRDPSLPADGAISWNVGRETALANRRVWWRRLGVPLDSTVFPHQVHADRVAKVTRAERGCGAERPESAIRETDALVTAESGLALAVQCADCVPILIYAPDIPAVAAIHAGWRGTVQRILDRVLDLLLDEGQRPEALWVVFGPSIGPCCYEVGEDVAAAWLAATCGTGAPALSRRSGRLTFDLWRANRLLLEQRGVPADRIEVSGICTRCRPDEWFSYRACGPRAGAQAAVIALPCDTE
ncbi:MAG: peptidoglycan editing factor PgeF [Thermomicrobium sp.]|nr:peptidoglycan editing factor PgeF [Thermomicrobium sp.]